MLLSAALALALAGAPASRATCPELETRIGPAAAPIEIVAYLDPFAGNPLALWLELRRLASDHAGLVSVRIVLAPTMMVELPGDARLLRWLIAAAARGKQEAALRVLDRDGRDRLSVRLADPAARPALAAELGLDPEVQTEMLADRCADEALHAGRLALRRHHAAAGGYLGRPPIFSLGPPGAGGTVTFEDSSTLDRLRLEVARERQRIRGGRVVARPPPPTLRGVSPRLVRPPIRAGMLVGGVGLPHRLVIFADHDEHPNFSILGPVLEFRRQHPGRLAVQVIARGTTTAARELRVRLCVAERLGFQLEYLRLLAREGGGGRREARGAAATELLARLDGAAEAQSCDLSEPELERGPGGVTGLPEGVWLDGAAVGQSDLDALPGRLAAQEAARRPLDAVFSATASEL